MKKYIINLFLSSIILWSAYAEQEKPAEQKVAATMEEKKESSKKTSNRKCIDRIDSIVHGPERSEIFCQSDHERRGIDGRPRTLKDGIIEELIYQDAIRYKVPVDDTIVKEHLKRTVQMFGLKPGEEEIIFAREGYSYDEGFNKFRLMYANNIMVEHRIKQRMLITEEEVIKYFNDHPIIKEPKYQLQTAFVPVDKEKGFKEKGVLADIDRYIKTGKGIDITWSNPYWINKSDIAEHLKFIFDLEPETIEKQKVIDGFQLYKLITKKPQRTVPLKKRYREIVDTLRKPKFEETFHDYCKSLLDGATIVYL